MIPAKPDAMQRQTDDVKATAMLSAASLSLAAKPAHQSQVYDGNYVQEAACAHDWEINEYFRQVPHLSA